MADGAGIGSGLHLIAGEWVAGAGTFRSSPWTGRGPRLRGRHARPRGPRRARGRGRLPGLRRDLARGARAPSSSAIADEIEARGAAITEVGTSRSGLPAARLEGERGRTTGQLRLFARHIRDGAYLDRRHDAALPDRAPLPRPDLRLMQRPDRPGRGVRRLELPARLLGRRRRHRLGARRRLPGGGQGPLGPSRHRRGRGRGDPRRRSRHCGMPEGVFSPDPGRPARRRRGARAAPADQGGGLHRLARRGPRAVRPLRRAARADPVLRRAGLGQPDVRAARGARARGATQIGQGLGRLADAWARASSAPTPASPC